MAHEKLTNAVPTKSSNPVQVVEKSVQNKFMVEQFILDLKL